QHPAVFWRSKRSGLVRVPLIQQRQLPVDCVVTKVLHGVSDIQDRPGQDAVLLDQIESFAEGQVLGQFRDLEVRPYRLRPAASTLNRQWGASLDDFALNPCEGGSQQRLASHDDRNARAAARVSSVRFQEQLQEVVSVRGEPQLWNESFP